MPDDEQIDFSALAERVSGPMPLPGSAPAPV
jgi:hypothetical protein